MLRHVAFAILALTLVACGGSGSEAGAPQQTLRPGTAPDFVILSVSGHCGVLCNPPVDNDSYLADPQDAVEAILQTLNGLGFTTQASDYSDRFESLDRDGDGTIDEFGFLQLIDDLDFVYDNWIDGRSNPTRILVVAHSHGATWAHIAVSVVDQVPIEYLISLDGVCFLWGTEHQGTIQNWFQANGNPYAWDISAPCNIWNIPGQAAPYNTKDVVFDNVVINLEVQSDDLFISDCCDNYRLDGSQTGIEIFASTENHGEVHRSGSASMAWVQTRIATRETAPP